MFEFVASDIVTLKLWFHLQRHTLHSCSILTVSAIMLLYRSMCEYEYCDLYQYSDINISQ